MQLLLVKSEVFFYVKSVTVPLNCISGHLVWFNMMVEASEICFLISFLFDENFIIWICFIFFQAQNQQIFKNTSTSTHSCPSFAEKDYACPCRLLELLCLLYKWIFSPQDHGSWTNRIMKHLAKQNSKEIFKQIQI